MGVNLKLRVHLSVSNVYINPFLLGFKHLECGGYANSSVTNYNRGSLSNMTIVAENKNDIFRGTSKRNRGVVVGGRGES